MKETKLYPLITISIILLLASFILLCILGYNFYTRAELEKKLAVTTSAKKINQQTNTTRDSLQKLYTATVDQFKLGNQIDSTTLSKADSLQLNLDTKLADYIKLKNEIGSLLNNNSSIADLNLAKQKIDELQLRVEELRNKNLDIENENKRLNAMLAQYMNAPKQSNVSTRTIVENNNIDAPFTASELRLSANNESNNEVSEAEATDKFVGSFAVKNNANLNNAELMVVVVQPNGRVLKNAWESGTFETNEGKKIYSRKIKFDYSKGEVKRLNFSLDADEAQKGNYIMQLYNKGKLIGKAVKTVS